MHDIILQCVKAVKFVTPAQKGSGKLNIDLIRAACNMTCRLVEYLYSIVGNNAFNIVQKYPWA